MEIAKCKPGFEWSLSIIVIAVFNAGVFGTEL